MIKENVSKFAYPTTAGGMAKKQQVQYLLTQKNNHMTANNPHDLTASKHFYSLSTSKHDILEGTSDCDTRF